MEPDALNFLKEGLPGEVRALVLYESNTTRVTREISALGSVIIKQALGPDAAARQGEERSLLQTLAGIDGVVRLAEGNHPADALTLEDCGGVALSAALGKGPLDCDLAVMAGGQPRDGPGDAQGAGEIVGTPAYLAPEQTGRTGHAVDHRADLYSVGVTLFEMVTGTLPFAADDMLQLIHDHLVREPAIAVNAAQPVPAMLSALILRLLAKAPADR
jgi:serine/threonine protein kinase